MISFILQEIKHQMQALTADDITLADIEWEASDR